MVVPGGLLARLRGKRDQKPVLFAKETERIANVAMQVVMDLEERLGYVPRDVSRENLGSIQGTGRLRFIEVKGRLQGAKTVTVTKNEILTAMNKPDDYILALVLVPPSQESPRRDPWELGEAIPPYGTNQGGCRVFYIRRPFQHEPDFGVTSVNYDLADLLARAEVPT